MEVAETLPSSCNITLSDTTTSNIADESTSVQDDENHNELTVSPPTKNRELNNFQGPIFYLWICSGSNSLLVSIPS